MEVSRIKVVKKGTTVTFSDQHDHVNGSTDTTLKFEKCPAQIEQALAALAAPAIKMLRLDREHHNQARVYGVSFSTNKDGDTVAVASLTSHPEGLPSPITINVPALILTDEMEVDGAIGSNFATKEFSQDCRKLREIAGSCSEAAFNDQMALDFSTSTFDIAPDDEFDVDADDLGPEAEEA